MTIKALLIGAALAVGSAGLAQAATPAAGGPAKTNTCFFSRNWDGWRAPDENTLYLRVGVRDIYRVDLSSGSRLLTWPSSHLISRLWGTSSICSPLDLDLSVSDGGGFREFLIAKAITKLSREEVAAIPRKDLP